MKQGTAQVGEHAHRSFLHASNGAREFHKLIHGISEQSPVLGSALRLAISPVAGLFAVGTLAASEFNRVIEETNRLSDEMQKGTDTPIFKWKTWIHEATLELQKFGLEMSKWFGRKEKDQTVENLNESIGFIRLKSQAAIKAGGDPDKINKATTQLEFDMQARALQSLAPKIGSADEDVRFWKRQRELQLGKPNLASAQANIKAEEGNQERLKAMLNHLEGKKTDLDIAGKWMVPPKMYRELEGQIASTKEQLKAGEKRIDENNKAIEEETARRNAVSDKLKEAQTSYDYLKGEFDSLSKALEGTRQHLSILTGVSNPEHAAEAPSTVKSLNKALNNSQFALAMSQYNQDKAMQDWRRTHGLSWHDVTMPINANQTTGDVKSDIAQLNTLFQSLKTPDGLKVNLTVTDD